jgi:hypothetical protein
MDYKRYNGNKNYYKIIEEWTELSSRWSIIYCIQGCTRNTVRQGDSNNFVQ